MIILVSKLKKIDILYFRNGCFFTFDIVTKFWSAVYAVLYGPKYVIKPRYTLNTTASGD